MMTSVTLSSSSGAIHGGYSSVTGGETASNSEPDYDTAPRSIKRYLAAVPSADSCKKRRKQSTPIRISATEIEEPTTIQISSEGKPAAVTPEPEIRCPVCQLYFDTSDQLQNHIVSDHPPLECKKEIEDLSPTSTPLDRSETPLELTMPRSDVHWLNEIQNKEWKNPSISNISFNPPNSMFMTLPQFVQSDNIPRQPIRIFNPDAYCDLCNKEFCNKYFLKTHKANKHGIYTDTPMSESVPSNCVNIPSFTGNIKPPTTVPSVETIPFIKSEPKLQPNILSNPFSDNTIYTNPFSNKFLLAKKQTVPGTAFLENESNENQNSNGFSFSNSGVGDSNDVIKKISDDQIADESSSPHVIVPPTESTSYKNDAEYFFEHCKMSPGQQSSRDLDLSNRLRKIGVMNPKAFCEICCKEYCNKYFLRTHKMKRHGIFIPDDRERDVKMEGGFTWQHHSVQTSPLNLIMTEQTDRKTTSPNDISCEICGIKFQNASLAQLHNVSVHGKISGSKEQQEQVIDNCENENIKKSQEPINNIGSGCDGGGGGSGDGSGGGVIVDKSSSSSLNAETISEDLQKLQTMILQLNDLDVSKVYRSCNSCNKEFENRYFLHAHMMTEHGILLDDNTDVDKQPDSENSSNNNTMCEIAKEGQNVDEIKNHLAEFQSVREEQVKEEFTESYHTPEKNLNRISTSISSGQITDRRISMNVTPTSSYCDICNKELCNKYFMKTHMQRMHGIEIENGAQIGGVVCDICNKELCSKYFLRVHKHNTHGIVEYGSSLLQPRKSESDLPTASVLQTEPDSALKPADLADLSHRYFSHFTEVCTICSRRFRSTKWLKAHLLSDHGQAGAEKWTELEQQLQQTMGQKPSDEVKAERCSPTIKIPNGGGAVRENVQQSRAGIQNVLSSLFGVDESTYQCSYCSFTTTLLPLLFVHERSHSINSNGELPQLKCPACPQSFLKPELLQHHLFTQHPFLPLPPFFNGNNNSQGEMSKETIDSASTPVPSTATSADNDENKDDNSDQKLSSTVKKNKTKSKIKRLEIMSTEIGQSLKDVAKRVQLPATYALPHTSITSNNGNGGSNQSLDQQDQGKPTQGQGQEDIASCVSSAISSGGGGGGGASGYVMQAFLLEESAPERRVVPAVVFLPVVQKQPAPLTVTFTLTPA